MNLLLSFMTIGSVFVFLSLLVADLIILAFYRAEINCVKNNPKRDIKLFVFDIAVLGIVGVLADNETEAIRLLIQKYNSGITDEDYYIKLKEYYKNCFKGVFL